MDFLETLLSLGVESKMYEDFLFGIVVGALLCVVAFTILVPNNTEVKRTFSPSCTEYFNATIVCNEYVSRGFWDFYPDKVELFRK